MGTKETKLQNDTSRSHTANNAATITPDDDDTLNHPCDAIYCGGPGNVVVVHSGNNTEITYAVSQGQILPVKAIQVKATGTTATSLVAWWDK